MIVRIVEGVPVCEHGTAVDVHCCNCHSGFLFDVENCTCIKGEAMEDPKFENVDAINLLRVYMSHCRFVRRGLDKIRTELSERAERHDDSKLFADEFGGFSRISAHARKHAYGSPEYRQGLKDEKSVINLHYQRNSHHPEYHGEPRPMDIAAIEMGFLDIIEMVCDWRAAYLAYGSKGAWGENIEKQKERYKVGVWFTSEQWWLIDQVANFVTQVVR